jgi:hypothetical protein
MKCAMAKLTKHVREHIGRLRRDAVHLAAEVGEKVPSGGPSQFRRDQRRAVLLHWRRSLLLRRLLRTHTLVVERQTLYYVCDK